MDQIKIGKFIASCRKDQGMTQAVLAEKLGISDRAVSKWETGKSLPDAGIISCMLHPMKGIVRFRCGISQTKRSFLQKTG